MTGTVHRHNNCVFTMKLAGALACWLLTITISGPLSYYLAVATFVRGRKISSRHSVRGGDAESYRHRR
jgi:hypothetical protein